MLRGLEVIIIVFALTVLIHLIATLAYAVRLVGVRTGRLAITSALFNLFMLVSRISNAVQGPLLGKKVDLDLSMPVIPDSVSFFRWMVFAGSLGTLIGALVFPSFRRLFNRWVLRFDSERSVPRLILHSFSKTGIRVFRHQLKAPSKHSVSQFLHFKDLPIRLILFNIISVSILTVGSFASLYSTYLVPEFRITAMQLSPIITGFATLVLFIYVDPYLSILTDDVIAGKQSDAYFFSCIICMIVSRLFGTILAMLLLVPAAKIIAYAAILIR